jgi:hypothetical protein
MEICLNLAPTSIMAEYPSGKLPTTLDNYIFGLFKDAPEAIPQQLTSETGCFQIQFFA